ncbi:MAG: hypothetical protein QXH03_00340 [Candidatus Bathyarchaeia archaeon]
MKIEVFEEFEDFYRMCQDLIEHLLEKLFEEAEKLKRLERALPVVPLTRQTFEFAPEITWPWEKDLLYVRDTKTLLYELRTKQDREKLAEEIIDRVDGLPEKIREVVQKIEGAIEWCKETEEKLKEEKRKVFEEERKAVEELRARSCLEVLAKGGRNGSI